MGISCPPLITLITHDSYAAYRKQESAFSCHAHVHGPPLPEKLMRCQSFQGYLQFSRLYLGRCACDKEEEDRLLLRYASLVQRIFSFLVQSYRTQSYLSFPSSTTRTKRTSFIDFDGTIFLQDTGHVLFDSHGCGTETRKMLSRQIKSGERPFKEVFAEMWGSLNVNFHASLGAVQQSLIDTIRRYRSMRLSE